MVKTRSGVTADPQGHVDLQTWLKNMPSYLDSAAQQDLQRAAQLAAAVKGSSGASGSDWSAVSDSYVAGLEIAQILLDLHLGRDSLVAGILYRCVNEERLSLGEVERQFGERCAQLISGVQRMSAISELNIDRETPVLGQADGQKENIRKMLVAMVDDVRVALIKLAERTCAIRAVKNDELRRKPIAREVLDVYAPLAHRLGIGQLKWELEDLSFRYLYGETYHKIAKLLDAKRVERDEFIEQVKVLVLDTLAKNGIEAQLSGRAKHIYSIWRKMQHKGIGFSQVYDIRAIRVLVGEPRDCYAVLGIVHGLWRNIPNEFDDYIANPKENGYRSLHTAVIGPGGMVLEVQIRTVEMDEEAELGVCAHWRYKGTDSGADVADSYEEKIAWLREVLDWHEETGEARSLAEQFSVEVAQDRVYVFTPQGDVVNLALGATPLDFAYHVHTEVGHNCRGAKVNGSIVPLTYQLQTGQRVEILIGRHGQPRRDWLQPGLGFLKTSRARAKVQHWFRTQARDDNVEAGRHLLEREFRRLALTSIDYKHVAERVQQATVDEMYAAVGSGELNASQVLSAAQGLLAIDPQEQPLPRLAKRRVHRAGGVEVRGIGNLLTQVAGCCKPLPGDEILGFITQGRGVSIHRHDCSRLLHLQLSAPERIVDVEWGGQGDSGYEVDIGVEAYDRPGLLRDITELLAQARLNVISVNTQTNKKRHTATMRLTVEVPDLMALGKLLDRIIRLNNVISAVRLSETGVDSAL